MSHQYPVTLTINCPAPPAPHQLHQLHQHHLLKTTPPANNAAPAAPAPAAPAPAAPAPAGGIPITIVERQIFQRPYAALVCTQSLVELRKDLIPTTDFPALVNETISTHNVTVLNVYNVPDYKAMLLAQGDEKKVIQDTRLILAPSICGEMILEPAAESCANY